MKLFRNNQIVVGDDVYFFLKILCKVAVIGTDASMTRDQMADDILRHTITTDHPELVLAYEKNCRARQDAKREYDKIEAAAIGIKSLAENEIKLET